MFSLDLDILIIVSCHFHIWGRFFRDISRQVLKIVFRSLHIWKLSEVGYPHTPYKAHAFSTSDNAPPPPVTKNLATALGSNWSSLVWEMASLCKAKKLLFEIIWHCININIEIFSLFSVETMTGFRIKVQCKGIFDGNIFPGGTQQSWKITEIPGGGRRVWQASCEMKIPAGWGS